LVTIYKHHSETQRVQVWTKIKNKIYVSMIKKTQNLFPCRGHDGKTYGSCGHRQKRTLRKHLPNKSASTCADGGANGQLASPGSRTCKEHTCKVKRGDQ